MNTKIFLATIPVGLAAMILGQFSASALPSEKGEGGLAMAGADVIVGAIPNVSKYGSAVVNGRTVMAYAIGTTSCNIGTAQLEWFASPDNRHPFIPMNAFRYRNGRFEQIGLSWGKHGFTALQQTLCGSCQASSTGNYLGIGCSDPYSSSLNGGQSGLGARHEINAATGVFPGSYNSGMPSAAATIGRRLQIDSAFLDPAQNVGSQYFFEAQYIHQQDATAGNKMNNASYRGFTVGTLSSGAYTLTLTGATMQQKPAIEAWPLVDANATIANADVPSDGRFIAGVSVRDNGNGTWRYEYAVHNLNSDRSGRSFSVPVPDGVTITNIGFKDIDYHSGDPFSPTDWTSSASGGVVTWAGGTHSQSTTSNALRFATMYNFWFDADQPPQVVNATIGLFKPGSAGAPASIGVASKGPSAPPSNPADLDGDGLVTAEDLTILLSNWGGSGDGDINSDGIVDAEDLTAILSAWSA